MKKSKFNLSYLNSTTGNAGYLIPFLLQPTLPNDTFRISLSSFIRAQPMLAPLMHEVKFFTQYWFVPNRIIWNEWEDFITGGNDLSFAPSVPVLPTGTTFEVGSLGDYFGYPIGVDCGGISILPFRAYNEIWNTRYRDEDLQSEYLIGYHGGEDRETSLELLSPSWKRDYFTTARPFTQRGSDISVPVYPNSSEAEVHSHQYRFSCIISNSAEGASSDWSVQWSASNPSFTSSTLGPNSLSVLNNEDWLMGSRSIISDMISVWLLENLNTLSGVYPPQGETLGTYEKSFIVSATINNTLLTKYGLTDYSASFSCVLKNVPLVIRWRFINDVHMGSIPVPASFRFSKVRDITQARAFPYQELGYIELMHENKMASSTYDFYYSVSSSANVKIRDLRAASALQRYGERSLQWGNRYEEFIQREFGIKPRDSRIQRPEYLGGGSGTLQISEVLQTAEGADTGVGTMRGHGVAGLSQRPIKFRAPEHGFIIGLISIRPKPVYTQGVNRELLKKSRLDYFTPELANIGMQEVLQRELFVSADNADAIFGYSDRYQEYRYNMPKVTGEFRTTLSFWNMARQFDAAPVLNDSFIDMSNSQKAFYRPFASQTTHQFLMMLRNNIKAYRPVPKRARNILK